MTESELDVTEILNHTEFDVEKNLLTRRQAEVFALREEGLRQRDIANLLGTSRANISNMERSAQDNIDKATETIDFATVLTAPARVMISPETDLYEVPKRVYDAADDAGIEFNHTAPDLTNVISNQASAVVKGRAVRNQIVLGITDEGEIYVRQPNDRSEK